MSSVARTARGVHTDLSPLGDRLRYPAFSNADAIFSLVKSVPHSLRYVPPLCGTLPTTFKAGHASTILRFKFQPGSNSENLYCIVGKP